MAPRAACRPLGQILLKASTILAGALEAARAQKARERMGEALIAVSAVTPHDVLAALALQCELPFLSRKEFQVRIAHPL
jgi:hypothetical protein